MKNNRREFIKRTSLAGLAVGAIPIQKTLDDIMGGNSPENKILFQSPIDGDMLNEYDGIVSDGYLMTTVKVLAPSDRKLKFNGAVAKYEDGVHLADVRLKDYKNVIEVVDTSSGETQSIIVFWLKNYINKYRLSLDDNIWFLKDISANAGKYKSIFENPYLGFLKEVHDTYGTKIHLNLFYQTDGFNLSQMTDKYKNEWKANAGWLRLSFHALQEFPDRPYIHASYNEMKKDCEMVTDQIRRFAGEELLGHVMTLHWGEATVEGCRALRDSGYTALAGYFNVDDTDNVSYYLDIDKRRHMKNRFIWRDNSEGIIFTRMALVINTVKLDKIVPYLDDIKSNSHKPAYIDLMIHEQYFYPFYKNYQPDYRQKVLTSVRWAVNKGYKPAFLSECVFA
jgi:hypothetical protein